MHEYLPFPEKRYAIIYADPPWSYRDKALAGKRGAGCKYSTQADDWVKHLPIQSISADDCALFLWITMPKLDMVFDIITHWGFEYKTAAFTWVKRNKLASSWFWGMGNWTRSNPELCLLATKGHPKRVSAAVHSVVDEPIERHSKKPSIVRERIVNLMGDLPRIELFARQGSPGWDVWGNEIGNVPTESESVQSLFESTIY